MMESDKDKSVRPPKLYKLYTSLWCEGCCQEVRELLDKNTGPNGILDYNIDYATKRLSVSTPLTLEELKLMLQKVGREITTEEPS